MQALAQSSTRAKQPKAAKRTIKYVDPDSDEEDIPSTRKRFNEMSIEDEAEMKE